MRIDPTASDLIKFPAGPAPAKANAASVFTLRTNSDDRINGSVPVWGAPRTPKEDIASALSSSMQKPQLTDDALSLAPDAASSAKDESFGFLDIIDMINPLQHIPIVGTVYRAITGDEIKPISQIVGGAAFGGFVGAASGVANAIVTAETGKDIGENVLGMLGFGEKSEVTDLPGTTVAVASLGYRQPHYNE